MDSRRAEKIMGYPFGILGNTISIFLLTTKQYPAKMTQNQTSRYRQNMSICPWNTLESLWYNDPRGTKSAKLAWPIPGGMKGTIPQ